MKKTAKESRKIEKARKKLKQVLVIEEQKFTQDRLSQIINKIRVSFKRHPHEALSSRKIILKPSGIQDELITELFKRD